MPVSPNELPFRQLVDAAPDGLVVCDAAGAIVLVNEEAERMFGYARDELVGNRIEVLIPERMRRRHEGHVVGYTTAPRLRPMGSGLDLQGRRKDGSEFPVEISLSPIKTAAGMLVTAGIRDVSQRRALEREARRANAYLTSAVESVNDAFALFDDQDRVVMMNSTARHLLGATSDRGVVGQKFEDLLDSALVNAVFDFSSESRDQLRRRWVSYHRAPSGSLEVRTGTGRYLRVTDRKTAEHGTVSVIADVTDDVHHEEQLTTARESAEAASAAKSEFLSSMSHELRTPLNAILGFAQLLERDRKNPLTDRQLERLQHVLRGGEHLLRLIDDVLDLSRIEAGRISISPEPVAVGDVMREVVHTLEPMAARAQIQIEDLVVPTAVPTVVADRTRLAQILMNLGSNAIKYGKPGGHVTFEIQRRGALLRISVIDDGIGIREDKRTKLFEPFQRAGQETGPIEGTGIGLTISKRLTELMRGTIGFSSAEGAGSTFWIDIPVHDTAGAEPSVESPALAAGTPLTDARARHVIVYVEDNPSNIAFMRDVIDELSSVDLMTAPTAEIGLDLIRAHKPAIVIMDINLPGMSGFDAVKQLHAWDETKHIPVVGLSAAALAKDTARAKETGFYRYLTKPVKVPELMEVLEELLGG